MPIILPSTQPAGRPKIFADNALDNGTPTASTTASGYSALNLKDWRPYTWWKPNSLPATITVDCTNARACDYAFIAGGHNLFSNACTVEVRGSTDGFAGSDVLLASYTPTSDADAVVMIFASATYRHWRLRITGSAAPSLAVLSIGAAVTMPGYLGEGFDPTGRRLYGDTNKNSRGQVLGKVVDFEEWSQSIEFVSVPWAWIRSDWLPIWPTLRSRPFAFAWDADNYPGETRLVTIPNGRFETPHNAEALCELSFDLEGPV